YVNDVTGRNTIFVIIDSGVSYLHPDLINNDGTSKIIKMWDQEGTTNPSPEGFNFGSEFSREEINEAIIRNDRTLSVDKRGTGTIVAGILVGEGRVDDSFGGIAKGAELLVIKLREYTGEYYDDKFNYGITDFLCAVAYAIRFSEGKEKNLVINMTVAARSTFGALSILQTFEEIRYPGVVLISGAGNQRDTYIHYEGRLDNENDQNDILIELSSAKSMDIFFESSEIDRFNVAIISPSGEVSYRIQYAPDYYEYKGKFNLENTSYTMRYFYPYLVSGSQVLEINLNNVQPGGWILRIASDTYVDGKYHIYIPNKNLITQRDGFIDSNSYSTITYLGHTDDILTVGTYDNRFNSTWVASSQGPGRAGWVKPDFIASGVDIISTYGDNGYRLGTGTGISSTIVAGIAALIMEYIDLQSPSSRSLMHSQVLKTYLMLGAKRSSYYVYPNVIEGYGLIDFPNTMRQISENI
ncbi:MAG: S8 family peptidase, partial [Clostridioides sp.]|nr:S8 family peptidase [Clostridioides sp.]